MGGQLDSVIAGGDTERAVMLLCNRSLTALGTTRSANRPESAR